MRPERVRHLNSEPPAAGRYVLYWMQQSQRAWNNHALEYAIGLANERDEPCLVAFGLTEAYPEANLRHYAFMLEGLADVAAALETRGIPFVLRRGSPDDVALELAQGASIVVCDRGYLKPQTAWRARVAAAARRRVVEVESDVVVPIDLVSEKAEHAARTIRPKILALREGFLDVAPPIQPQHPLRPGDGRQAAVPRSDVDLRDVAGELARLAVDRSIAPVQRFQGGTSAARARLAAFLRDRLQHYAAQRGEPVARACSELSPYLHFGQISPIELVLAVREASHGRPEGMSSFLEELIVRRELAMNFVARTPDYDRFSCLPAWARTSLQAHARDRRQHLYDQSRLEAGATHDPYWNAAMHEMRASGYMHNSMRMYWGKKVIEWTSSPEAAYETALALNNKLVLDGRDANSFANIGWLFGLHDRPWAERPVFGKVRYMNARGLERKFDIRAYVDWAHTL